MLAHVKRDEILALASQTARAAPKGAVSEAIQGIHMEADNRRSMLTLTATNYEIVIRASMGATVEQPGSVVVDPTLFPAILSKLPTEDVDLEVERNGRLTIRSGQSCFHLDVFSGDKYPMPELPFPDDTLPVSGLCSLVRNTAFAAAEEGSTSPQMKCVRLQVGPDGLKACTSNGFCIMEADGDKQCKGHIELLLPTHSLKVLASISKDSDVYEMGLAGKSLVFWSGTLLFSARLVEGRFPDTNGVFKQFHSQFSAHLNTSELRNAISVVSAVAESSGRIEIAFGEHEVILSAESAYRVSALWMERGKTSGYWKLTGAWDVLNLARFLRAAIRQSARPCADIFQEKLGEMEHISQYEFEVLQDAHDHNDVHINGVFSVDFSKHHFGFWLPGQGWRVYPFQDISSAAFKASRKNGATKEECLERFFGALEGRPFRTDPLPTEKEA